MHPKYADERENDVFDFGATGGRSQCLYSGHTRDDLNAIVSMRVASILMSMLAAQSQFACVKHHA